MSNVTQSLPPITVIDISNLGFDPSLVSLIISFIQRIEEKPNQELEKDEHIQSIINSLDTILLDGTRLSVKLRCFDILRIVLPALGILPESYLVPATPIGETPYASGRFADIWKGELNGKAVCIKAFRTQSVPNLDKIKREFYREIVRWKHPQNPNVVPFLGISEMRFQFSIISPWQVNGNIVEYTTKNEDANRLGLLAQAASGLEYLHAVEMVHGAIHPGNILISDNGTARLADLGITRVITDPAVAEPGTTTTPRLDVVRYMAPELLDPPRFELVNSNPTRESDIYSLAVTAYQLLTGTLPYGDVFDDIIISRVVAGDRPPRPENTRLMQDPIWTMITTCWSEKRDQRWDIEAMYNQLSASNIQEIAKVKQSDDTNVESDGSHEQNVEFET